MMSCKTGTKLFRLKPTVVNELRVRRRDLILKCSDKSKKPKYASRSPFKSQLSPFLYYFQKIYFSLKYFPLIVTATTENGSLTVVHFVGYQSLSTTFLVFILQLICFLFFNGL